MFIHKNIEYYIGYCQGSFELNIPSLKFFKTYAYEQKDKNANTVHQKAIDYINESQKHK